MGSAVMGYEIVTSNLLSLYINKYIGFYINVTKTLWQRKVYESIKTQFE